MKAVKTYIRTKSGNLIERIVFMSEEDYNKFIEGGAEAEEMLKKYLSKEEAENLESWDKEEVTSSITCYFCCEYGVIITCLKFIGLIRKLIHIKCSLRKRCLF